ncbi:DNA-binding response regulator, OmpR family, contains REC and winged-helix (wHTH) domain [Lachnospiraceae bacterium KH1T2]|nr:DNA-binding response regulator, OmpR family, contains REC and winged-helix (wHTH) domain [Lachnospiraceae bacterium KH1T2]
MFNILIVEDDKNTRRLMEAVLSSNGYHTFSAENGFAAFDVLEEQQIDLIILDIMMPKMDGYTFIKDLRISDSATPVLMVSAKSMPDDIKEGFRSGTDDYMVKPVDEEEMLLRIQALLRRAQITTEHLLKIGNVTLDYDSFSIQEGNNPSIQIPQKEFLLLYKLLSYPGKIFTRIQLMDEFWGMDSESGDSTITVHINRLRKRFENCEAFSIETVRGLGYRAVRNDDKG